MNGQTFDFSSLLAELNSEQRSAVMYTDGPLLVLAGAGTGKTRVITTRIAGLLAQGIDAESILAVSFTRKAGKEMKTRLLDLVGEAAEATHVSTFHSLGVTILREQAPAAQLKRNFQVCDEGRQLELCKYVYSHLEPRFFEGRARDFPGARVLKLKANYRCSSEIIGVANAVIRDSPGRHPKSLVSAKGPSAPVRFLDLNDASDEHEFIIDDIRQAKPVSAAASAILRSSFVVKAQFGR